MAIERITSLPKLPKRPRDGHKGTFGHVRVLAGSVGMSGAAVLCATAALRGGAGTVLLATPRVIQPIVAAAQSCYTTCELPLIRAGRFGDNDSPRIVAWANAADALAIGPGLGTEAMVARTIKRIVADCPKPMVLDADALNVFAPVGGTKIRPTCPAVLTPHPGELARLMGVTAADVQANREAFALRFAEEQKIVLVLKGAGTIVTDGRRIAVNTTGNPGMATGGSGDVLCGVIAALLAQELEPFSAAQAGVWLHGMAGDLAAAEMSEESMIASDLLDYLPGAWRKYRNR